MLPGGRAGQAVLQLLSKHLYTHVHYPGVLVSSLTSVLPLSSLGSMDLKVRSFSLTQGRDFLHITAPCSLLPGSHLMVTFARLRGCRDTVTWPAWHWVRLDRAIWRSGVVGNCQVGV